MEFIKHIKKKNVDLNIAILISGYGKNMEAIFKASKKKLFMEKLQWLLQTKNV